MLPETLAKLIHKYESSDSSSRKVIVILQTYNNFTGQENIRKICELIYKDTGFRLVTVEGADKEIISEKKNTSVREAMQQSDVSAGIISLLNSQITPICVWGVDNMSCIRDSHVAMATLNEYPAKREQFFNEVRHHLQLAQNRIYPSPIANLRTARLNMYNLSKPLTEQMDYIRQGCSLLHIDLKRFPNINRYIYIHNTELTINKKRALRQVQKFVSRLVKALHSWHKLKSRNIVTFDLKKVVPILSFWMMATGQTEKELERNFERAGTEAVFLNLKEWIDGWIVNIAQQSKSSGSFAAYDEYLRMALFIGVPFFDLLDFRKLVSINRLTNQLRNVLDNEMGDCMDYMVKELNSPEASALQRIENDLNLIYNAIRLTVTPGDAEYSLINVNLFNSLLNELGMLLGIGLLPESISILPVLNSMVEAADTFFRLSKSRGVQMIENTLELMDHQNEELAVLVAGGFHEQTIKRTLEDRTDISWEIYSVNIELTEVKSKFFVK